MSEIIKVPGRDDLYCLWSHTVDAPTGWGTREQIAAMLIEEEVAKITRDIASRLDRADRNGSSMSWNPPEHTEEGERIFRGLGTLPLAKLGEFLDSYREDDAAPDGEHWDTSLVTLWDDEDENAERDLPASNMRGETR